MNKIKIQEMRKNRAQLIECTYRITHISVDIFPRFHTHSLSKLVHKLKSRKSSIIELLDNNI